MTATQATGFHSVFRTDAWVQAWIDTWGNHPAIEMIDLGGSGKPLEQLYCIRHRIKKCLPARTLCLAGTGFGPLSTPRSEYNDIAPLVRAAGGVAGLAKELKQVQWHQWHLPDLVGNSRTMDTAEQLAGDYHWPLHTERCEPAYCVDNIDFDRYLGTLSASTRANYFNRRKRLEAEGDLQRYTCDTGEFSDALSALNQFHVQRWGRPCYATQSLQFIQNFLERLSGEGGTPLLETLTLDGKTISVLIDVLWQNRRYNLQSGYAENHTGGVSLGAIHLGYAIEDALRSQQTYDFLAGSGKNSNYKSRIANHSTELRSVILQHPLVAKLRSLRKFIFPEKRHGNGH